VNIARDLLRSELLSAQTNAQTQIESRMKPFAAVLLVAATLAQSVLAAEPRPNTTLLGSWAVDISQLPMAPSARPKSVTITFAEAGAQRLRTTVEVIDPSGARLEAEGVTPLDGSPTPVKSNFEADVSATTMPRPEVLIMQLAKNGSPGSTRIYAVSADGNTMVETVAYFSADGQPVLRKNYFSRVR
jgi:hypothetical protein